MTQRTCTVEECDRRHYGKGLCEPHYARMRRHGSIDDHRTARTDLATRFWAKVDRTDATGCWLWTGGINGSGYGSISDGDRPRGAHVVAVLLDGRSIPEGMEVDHLCNTSRCVRASHLRVVTRDVNWRRSAAPPAVHARKTHCVHGHEFTPENTRRDKNGNRACRACAAAYQRGLRARRRELT